MGCNSIERVLAGFYVKIGTTTASSEGTTPKETRRFCDSTYSPEVDYSELVPSLFELRAGKFYVALAAKKVRTRVLKIIRDYMKPDQRIFIGVVSPINPRIESPEEIRDLVLEAAQYIPADRLGTTDDCGFSPFSDDTSTARDTAFAKIGARVPGTALGAKLIDGG